jgi:phosphohistidine phosphatase
MRYRTQLLSLLDSTRYRRLLLRLERSAELEPHRSLRQGDALELWVVPARRALEQAMVRLLARGRRVARRKPTPSDHDLHELRILVRRARHQLELLLSGSGSTLGRPLVKELTRLQDLLGTHQDAVVARRLMRGCIERRSERLERAAEVAIGQLCAAQERRAAAARSALGTAWTRFTRAEPRAALEKICQRLQAEGRAARRRSRAPAHDEVTAMTCTLYLVRHAIAEVQSATGRDADRKLTREGIAKMRQVARGLQRMGVEPLARAEQTADVLCRVLAPGLSVRIHPPLAPGGSCKDLLQNLPHPSGAQHLLLVGHEPDLGRLAAHLLTGSPTGLQLPLKKGGIVAIEVSSLPPRTRGQLRWSLTPKQLRALGGARS